MNEVDDNTCVQTVPYILNNKGLCKKLLKKLDGSFDHEKDVKRKDKGKQFTVNISTTTYIIMINSIINMGKDKGINIVRRDETVDGNGQHIKAQFDVVITDHRLNVPITITCQHTTANMWIQLLGSAAENNWEDKKRIVASFVNVNIVEMIKKVEKLEFYDSIRHNLRQELSSDNLGSGTEKVKNLAGITREQGENRKIEVLSGSITALHGQDSRVVCHNTCDERSKVLADTDPDEMVCLEMDQYGNNDVMTSSIFVDQVSEAENQMSNSDISTISNISQNTDGSSSHNDAPLLLNAIQCQSLQTSNPLIMKDPIDEGRKTEDYSQNTADLACENIAVVLNECGTNADNPMEVLSVENGSISPKEFDKTAVVVYERPDRRKMSQCFDTIKKASSTDDERIRWLFNIILKLKERSYLINMDHFKFLNPTAVNKINDIGIKLIQKQKECDLLKKKNKELDSIIKDFKKTKDDEEKNRKQKIKENEEKDKISLETKNMVSQLTEELKEVNKKCQGLLEENKKGVLTINELTQEHNKKDNEIRGFKGINDQLRAQLVDLGKVNKSLQDKETEMTERMNVLQAVAGMVKDDHSNEQIVVVSKKMPDNHVLENEKELEKMKKSINELNRCNSLLKDDLQEKTDNLATIDSFYKEIINQKDKTISKYNDIYDADQDTERQFKRLLTKFRTENELKFMESLKESLEKDEIVETRKRK